MPENQTKSREWAAKFYKSFEWRSVRHDVLKRDGSKCAICGRTPKDGARMNVDHKLPLRKFPELALNLDNLQVLCSACNHGKANKAYSADEKRILKVVTDYAIYALDIKFQEIEAENALTTGGIDGLIEYILGEIHTCGYQEGLAYCDNKKALS